MSEERKTVTIDGEEVPLYALEKGAETQRRRKLIPLIAEEYLDPDNPTDIDALVEKYHIPKNSMYYYFKNEGISRKGVESTKAAPIQKEIRKVAQEVLSAEAEKIATIAFGLGATIAKRYLSLLDYMMAEGKTLDFIAEEIMQWYEMKHSTLAEIDELKTEIAKMDKELSAAWAMNLPNFRYWLRTKILERYAAQVINARLMGVRLPASSMIKAMQEDLLRLEGDVNELFEGETMIGIES
jgi:hypothetical protein